LPSDYASRVTNEARNGVGGAVTAEIGWLSSGMAKHLVSSAAMLRRAVSPIIQTKV